MAAINQISSQCAAPWGKRSHDRGGEAMTPMTIPAMPGTAMEPEDSMLVRMNARLPRARLSIGMGACMPGL